jgi:hypothetical protein
VGREISRRQEGNVWRTEVADVDSGPGGSISVTDGSTTVDPATSIDFSGATVTDEGGGVAGVAVGGSQPGIATEAINGLVKDYDPPGGIDAAGVILLDPTAQDWQAAHDYSPRGLPSPATGVGAFVHPVGDDSSKFVCAYVRKGTSGLIEPVWPTNGDGILDNDIMWLADFVWGGPWQAAFAFPSTEAIVANGSMFISDGGGDSGGSEPDWSTAPNPTDTVVDNDITWTNVNPAETWAAATEYTLPLQAVDIVGAFSVLPTAPVAHTDYIFFFNSARYSAPSGALEPTWDTNPNEYTIDGDLIWQETTDAEELVLTGLAAATTFPTIATIADPSGEARVKLIDEANVVGTYGAGAESAAANRFNRGGLTVTLNTPTSQGGGSIQLAHPGSRWLPIPAFYFDQ